MVKKTNFVNVLTILLGLLSIISFYCTNERNNPVDPGADNFIGQETRLIVTVDTSATINDEIMFRGSLSYKDAKIKSYEWDFDGDGIYDWLSSSTGTTSYKYSMPGIYRAVFRITDKAGDAETDTVTIKITDLTPIARLKVNFFNKDITLWLQDEAVFESLSEDDGQIIKYEWDIDNDGIFEITTTENQITHKYDLPGTYTTSLRVTDDDAHSAIDSANFEVTELPMGDFLWVSSVPAGGEVHVINGDAYGSQPPVPTFPGPAYFKGETPLRIELEPGDYTVQITLPAENVNYFDKFYFDNEHVMIKRISSDSTLIYIAKGYCPVNKAQFVGYHIFSLFRPVNVPFEQWKHFLPQKNNYFFKLSDDELSGIFLKYDATQEDVLDLIETARKGGIAVWKGGGYRYVFHKTVNNWLLFAYGPQEIASTLFGELAISYNP